MAYDRPRIRARRLRQIGLTVFLLSGAWLGHTAAADLAELMGAAGLVHFQERIQAPNFQIPTPDGAQMRLRDFRGRYVLLNFWATW